MTITKISSNLPIAQLPQPAAPVLPASATVRPAAINDVFETAPTVRSSTATAVAGSLGPAGSMAMGRLNWGLNPATKKPWTPEGIVAAAAKDPDLKAHLNQILKLAKSTLNEPIQVCKHIYSEGLLASDPLRKKSAGALRQMDDVYAWAQAARLLPPAQAKPYQKKVTAALLAWAKNYQPSGNPINENKFTAIFQAVDASKAFMSAHQRGLMDHWLNKFVSTSANVKLSPGCAANNWRTFNLAIRGVAAQAAGNTREVAKTRQLMTHFLAQTIYKDGSSHDFKTRDALHYHAYNLTAIGDLAMLAPQAMSSSSRAAYLRAVDFLKPYYTGHKKHVEFVHTTVAFDIQRKRAGEKAYQNVPWDPRDGNTAMAMARAVLPITRSWSAPAEAIGGRLGFTEALLWAH